MDSIHHIALQVGNIDDALGWYTGRFDAETLYRDAGWALIQFANIKLALVVAGQHPPHIAIERQDVHRPGPRGHHCDGTESAYIEDPFANVIEIMAPVRTRYRW